MTLGDAIKKYRNDHGLSIRAFSRITGLSPTYISYLEKGETHRGKTPVASIETYRVVAKAMGKELDELIREVDDMIMINSNDNKSKYPSKEQKEAIDFVMSLSEGELRKFISMGKIMLGEENK